MKKAELEEAYRELQYRYNKLQSDTREEIKKLEFFRQNERKDAISDIENKYYEHWKELNAKYMKRYIEELIMHDRLTFEFESDYDGYFTMKVRMDDKHLNEFTGQINMNRNSLEE